MQGVWWVNLSRRWKMTGLSRDAVADCRRRFLCSVEWFSLKDGNGKIERNTICG